MEKDVAPSSIMAAHYVNDDPAMPVDRTMPLCPYPTQATYDGKGAINVAASWACNPNTNLSEQVAGFDRNRWLQSSECALARRFTALVRACGVKGRRDADAPAEPLVELHTWLIEARACSIPAIETFATGMEQDGAAVRAALTEPWSSGQAEGQVNRLKLLKRQSYGCASFDLLHRRVLLTA